MKPTASEISAPESASIPVPGATSSATGPSVPTALVAPVADHEEIVVPASPGAVVIDNPSQGVASEPKNEESASIPVVVANRTPAKAAFSTRLQEIADHRIAQADMAVAEAGKEKQEMDTAALAEAWDAGKEAADCGRDPVVAAVEYGVDEVPAHVAHAFKQGFVAGNPKAARLWKMAREQTLTLNEGRISVTFDTETLEIQTIEDWNGNDAYAAHCDEAFEAIQDWKGGHTAQMAEGSNVGEPGGAPEIKPAYAEDMFVEEMEGQFALCHLDQILFVYPTKEQANDALKLAKANGKLSLKSDPKPDRDVVPGTPAGADAEKVFKEAQTHEFADPFGNLFEKLTKELGHEPSDLEMDAAWFDYLNDHPEYRMDVAAALKLAGPAAESPGTRNPDVPGMRPVSGEAIDGTGGPSAKVGQQLGPEFKAWYQSQGAASKVNSINEAGSAIDGHDLPEEIIQVLDTLNCYSCPGDLLAYEADGIEQYFFVTDGSNVGLVDTQGYSYPRYCLAIEGMDPSVALPWPGKKLASESKHARTAGEYGDDIFCGRYEYSLEGENANKFYEVFGNGDGTYSLHWGRIGTEGQWKEDIEKDEAERKAAEKSRKGYVKVAQTMDDAYQYVSRCTNMPLEEVKLLADTLGWGGTELGQEVAKPLSDGAISPQQALQKLNGLAPTAQATYPMPGKGPEFDPKTTQDKALVNEGHGEGIPMDPSDAAKWFEKTSMPEALEKEAVDEATKKYFQDYYGGYGKELTKDVALPGQKAASRTASLQKLAQDYVSACEIALSDALDALVHAEAAADEVQVQYLEETIGMALDNTKKSQEILAHGKTAQMDTISKAFLLDVEHAVADAKARVIEFLGQMETGVEKDLLSESANMLRDALNKVTEAVKLAGARQASHKTAAGGELAQRVYDIGQEIGELTDAMKDFGHPTESATLQEIHDKLGDVYQSLDNKGASLTAVDQNAKSYFIEYYHNYGGMLTRDGLPLRKQASSVIEFGGRIATNEGHLPPPGGAMMAAPESGLVQPATKALPIWIEDCALHGDRNEVAVAWDVALNEFCSPLQMRGHIKTFVQELGIRLEKNWGVIADIQIVEFVYEKGECVATFRSTYPTPFVPETRVTELRNLSGIDARSPKA